MADRTVTVAEMVIIRLEPMAGVAGASVEMTRAEAVSLLNTLTDTLGGE
jgi:hypothetical protein